jgi:hypothetical protein
MQEWGHGERALFDCRRLLLGLGLEQLLSFVGKRCLLVQGTYAIARYLLEGSVWFDHSRLDIPKKVDTHRLEIIHIEFLYSHWGNYRLVSVKIQIFFPLLGSFDLLFVVVPAWRLIPIDTLGLVALRLWFYIGCKLIHVTFLEIFPY